MLTAAEMAGALGLLYLTGASLAVVWTFMPHPGPSGDGTVRAMAGLAALLGVALRSGAAARRATGPLVHAALAVIQVVIAVAYAAGGQPSGDIRLFFIWATPFAALYFSRRAAAGHGLWTAAVMAVSLRIMPPATHAAAPAVFAMSVGCLAAVDALVSWAATKLRTAEADQRHAAEHDPLTGLANRAGFAEQAAAALAHWRADGGQLTVAVLDLDRFKVVNDTHGHGAGDLLLQAIAPRLQAAAERCGAAVARLGGDEFAVIRYDLTGQVTPAELAAHLSAAWQEPIDLGCTRTQPSGSLGVAVATDPDSTAESLLAQADAAMYHAKSTGPGTWAVFDGSMHAALNRRALLEERLHAAISTGTDLRMVYQPIAELGTGRWVGAEALLRWNDSVLGEVPPAEFVPLAEDSGLAVPLGELVIDQVLAQVARWLHRGDVGADFIVGINVSARQLRPGFAASVAAALQHWQVPFTSVALEITETALLGEPAVVAAEIAALHEAGIGLLLDDFGTGYASLTHLRRFPISVIKIDRSFVSGEHTQKGRVDDAVIGAILGLARAVGSLVIAEGVENPEQREQLVRLGCTLGQGWHFARPMEADAFATALASHHRDDAPSSRPPLPRTVKPAARYASMALLGLHRR